MIKEVQGIVLVGQNDQDIKRQEMSLPIQGLLSHGFYSKYSGKPLESIKMIQVKVLDFRGHASQDSELWG